MTKCLFGKTVSELEFEQYLTNRSIRYQYEEPTPGITRLLDYTINVGGTTVRLEVKEWAPQEPMTGFFGVDIYGPIRDKIDEVKKQFNPYKDRGEPCCLVLVHVGSQLIVLNAMSVYGAMRGNAGFTFPVDPATGAGDVDSGRYAFLPGDGSMVRGKSGMILKRNTTISAIVVLSSLDVRGRRIKLEFQRRELAAGRPTLIERVQHALELSAEEAHIELRVEVYDNVDAKNSLPQGFPSGPYDERFGAVGDYLGRTYVGTSLRTIETEEHALGIQGDNPLGLRGSG